MEPIKIEAYRWTADAEGEWLCLRLKTARQTVARMDPAKTYDVQIKEHRKRRSLDANAYAWVLMGKLAAALQISPNEVYQQYIPDIGGNYFIVPVLESRLDKWDGIWCEGHLGRITEDMGACKTLPGYNNVRSYFGSSDYDTRQMSRLIDLIVSDCKDNGIETLTPDKLDAMKGEWK